MATVAMAIGSRPYPVRLREARRSAGLSELYAALETGIDPSDYQAVEAGLKKPSLKQREALEEFIKDIGGEPWKI